MAISKWTGELDLSIFNNGRKSVSRDVYFQGALKVIRPIYLNYSDFPTYYLVNVGGGFLDGDRYRLNVEVQKDATVTLTSQGATKIYKTLEDRVEQYQTFTIDDYAHMEYVGDPVIAYKYAKFYQKNVFNISKTGSMYYTDIITPGWSEDDKDFTYDYMHMKNEIYVDDALVVYDNLKLEPNKNRVDSLGYMEGFTHYGSCFFIHPELEESLVLELREIIEPFKNNCRLGISMLPTHGISVRILANMTEHIEEVFWEIQSYVTEKYFNRQIDFLRKY